MASEILGLFTTPNQYNLAQDQMAQQQALQYAQLNPFQRAETSLFMGGRQLGGALGRIFGIEDPQLKLISQRQQLSQGLDVADPNAILQRAQQAAEMGDMQFATVLADYARKAAEDMAKMRAQAATAAKNELTVQQEMQLRDELAKLGPNPAQEDVVAVVSKYGSPERVLSTMTTAATTRESIAARKDIAEENRIERERAAKDRAAQRERELEIAHQNRLEALKQQNADKADLEREKMRAKAELEEEKRKAKAEADAEKKANKTLTAGLQVKEDEDLKMIDSLNAQQKALAPAIKALTPDPKTGKTFLSLGPIQNKKYEVLNAAGRSTPESRAYENLKSAVDTAVNIQVSAEKGVQTDRDVLRFAQALIGAYGRNDTKATLEALNRFNSAVKDSVVKTQQVIESRRKSQGVAPYYGEGALKTETPKRVKFIDLPK